jgi:pimeloyl-ACP methyl ester carboxylesterase
MPADAVVLLHGQPDTRAVWLPVRRRLVGVRVFAPDRPGYGTNPRPPTDLPGNVDWLLALLDRARIGRAVLAGHSWAGGVALLAAARHPDRVHGLALVASVGPGGLHAYDHVLAWPGAGELAAFAGLRLARPVQAYRARRLAARRLPSDDRAIADMEIAAQFHRPVWRSFLVEQRALVRQLPLLSGALGAVRAPTVVLAGTRDSVIPRRGPELLAAQVPGATLRRVDGAGHDLPLQKPDEVAETIRGLAACTG